MKINAENKKLIKCKSPPPAYKKRPVLFAGWNRLFSVNFQISDIKTCCVQDFKGVYIRKESTTPGV